MKGPVFIVGASGVFGSHLARQLAATGSKHLVLAGRSATKAQALLEQLQRAGCEVSFQPFDRSKPDAAVIRSLAPCAVIDCAGPFQHSTLALPEACIEAGVTYIDLCDARDFVARFEALDGRAKARGVALVTGASSTPALSHAALDELTKDWRAIHSVRVAIVPGNRAPRGLSVVKAILDYVGEPVRVFAEGTWQSRAGWSLNEKLHINGVGRRNAALCETPDLDLLVARYRPLLAAEFKAGLELGLMHQGVRLLSWLRGRRLLPNLARFAKPLRAAAALLLPFGSDRGGMLVMAEGRDAEGRPVRARWSLAAAGGIGPVVPCLPALVLASHAEPLASGARPAAGLLSLAELQPHFSRLGLVTETEVELLQGPQPFERALGSKWQIIPPITREIHTAIPSILLKGEAEVEGAATRLGAVIARLFGFPVAASNVPLRVVIEADGASERWRRIYPTRTMPSLMTRPDPERSTLEEWLGPFRFTLKLVPSALGIDLVPVGLRLWRLPLPLWLLPRVEATERASPDGRRHFFDVRITAPLVGLLVHYRGWLECVRPA